MDCFVFLRSYRAKEKLSESVDLETPVCYSLTIFNTFFLMLTDLGFNDYFNYSSYSAHIEIL